MHYNIRKYMIQWRVGEFIQKVAFVITGIYHISGIASATTLIANELAKNHKWDVTLITLTDRSNTQFVHVNEKVKIIKVFDYKINLKINLLKIIHRLQSLLYNENFDIIVVPTLIFYVVSLALDKRSKFKLVAWDHASIPEKNKYFSLQYFIRKIAAEKSNAIVVITEAAKEIYVKRYKKIKQIVQIYNATTTLNVDDSKYDKLSKKIISVGTLEKIKGFDMAVEVAKNLLVKYPDWQWHIYGDGRERKSIQKVIERYSLESQLILMGHSERMYNKYREYSFLVSTSRKEAFGMVILEAQQNKLPVISFNCPYGPNELILNGINGFLINPFDISQMVDKMQYMIENPMLRENMSYNSMVQSEKMLRENVIKEWEDLLLSL